MNISLLSADIIRKKLSQTPPGQRLFNAPGTYEWICPPGITKISVALVGAGGAGKVSTLSTGYGANVRYKNDIPVTPGLKYTLYIPPAPTLNNVNANNGTSAFGFYANSAISGIILGIDGTAGKTNKSNIIGDNGGNAGWPNVAYNGGYGIDLKTFNRVAPTTAIGASAGGGGGYTGGLSYQGGGGAIRIIWGKDRAFPNLNINDV